ISSHPVRGSIMFQRLACFCVMLVAASVAGAQERPDKVDVAGGKLTMTAPDTWVRKQPSVRIIEHEFNVPPAEGDSAAGRVTVMGAGGGVQANVERWLAQFSRPGGGKLDAKQEKLDVAGQEVTLVDISGTFKDQRGPMAPAVERPKYRMLGAIIATK